MAKKTTPPTGSGGRKKNRWYHNLADSYKIVARTYTWLPIAMVALPVALIGGGFALAFTVGPKVMWILTSIMLAMLADMTLLSALLRPAMYTQIDGTVGSVYAVTSQIKRGWSVSEEPAAVSREQDIVWRIVGRPGVVLISEGPSNRVRPMLNNERKKIQRITQNAPVIFIEVGNQEGQTPLKKLNRKLRRLKNQMTKQEVPAVAVRLDAVGAKATSIPRGIDPNNTRANRRALRG